MKTGNTAEELVTLAARTAPQWSPVMKTGNTGHVAPHAGAHAGASMEPGHEDREYEAAHDANPTCSAPQWSPVMKTGNT